MRKDILDKKERILFLINKNVPKAYICRELKCQEITFNSWLTKMNIEYHGNKGLRGYINKGRKPVKYYLKSNGPFIKSYDLKNKLIEENIKSAKCEKCNNNIWNNEIIPLELHHKDGNKHNNNLENLEILCPNCHAQTSNFCSKNKKSNIEKYICDEKYYSDDRPDKPAKTVRTKKIHYKNFCDCGKEIRKDSTRCYVCDKINQRKIKDRPPLLTLLKDVNETSYTATGKKYGVCDGSIKKWIKSYGGTPPRKLKSRKNK